MQRLLWRVLDVAKLKLSTVHLAATDPTTRPEASLCVPINGFDSCGGVKVDHEAAKKPFLFRGGSKSCRATQPALTRQLPGSVEISVHDQSIQITRPTPARCLYLKPATCPQKYPLINTVFPAVQEPIGSETHSIATRADNCRDFY
jgi:hypothetical protein